MKRMFILVFVLAAVAGALSQWATAQPTAQTSTFAYPAPTGPYAVGRIETVWIDSSREEIFTDAAGDLRQIPAYIWYPARNSSTPVASWLDPVLAPHYSEQFGLPLESIGEDFAVHAHLAADVAVSDTPFPVLIMSHGNGWFPELYTSFAESLASHGYVVVGVRHPYNAAAALLADGSVALAVPAADVTAIDIPPNANQLDVLEMTDIRAQELLAVQVGDLRFVLDQVERMHTDDPLLAGRLDLAHVGVFGHSFGGATAVEALLADERFAAAALIDGSLFSDMSAGSDRPILALFADVSLPRPDEAALALPELSADEAERLINILGRVHTLVAASPDAALVTVAGAQHINFSDAGLLGALVDGLEGEFGSIDGHLALEITNAYLLAFFDETLRGAPARLSELPAQYPESALVENGAAS